MRTSDFSKPVTAKSLNESLANQFGETIDVERFSLEQLYDARNKLRTKLSQIETNENYDSVKTDAYQKSKLFLDVLNTAIDERVISEKAESQAQQKAAGAALSAKRGDTPKSELTGASKEMLDMSTKELEKFAGTKHKGLPKKKTDEGKQIIENYFTYAMKLAEGAEDKAELVMAAKDMVDRLTGWMEDTAEMQTESMLELADAIRDELGQEQSDSFVNSVKPSLEQLYSAMETTRVTLTQGVSMIAGEGEMPATMGAEDDMSDVDTEMEPTDDMDTEVEPEEDDFGAAEPAAGGEEEAGREKRESVERSRRLGMTLSKKKVTEDIDTDRLFQVLKFLKDKGKTKISFTNLDKMMKNLRMPQFNYELFKSAYDEDPKLQSLVNNFNDQGVFFDKSETVDQTQDADSDTVSQMAKSATDLSDL